MKVVVSIPVSLFGVVICCSRVAAFLGLTVLAACGDSTTATPTVAPAQPVRVVAVQPVSGSAELEVAGTVRLKRETPLAFNSPGRIASIDVREGDQVSAGQVLARLDTTALRANQASAAAEVVRAQAELKRSEDLFAKGWVAASSLEQARATAVARGLMRPGSAWASLRRNMAMACSLVRIACGLAIPPPHSGSAFPI